MDKNKIQKLALFQNLMTEKFIAFKKIMGTSGES